MIDEIIYQVYHHVGIKPKRNDVLFSLLTNIDKEDIINDLIIKMHDKRRVLSDY